MGKNGQLYLRPFDGRNPKGFRKTRAYFQTIKPLGFCTRKLGEKRHD